MGRPAKALTTRVVRGFKSHPLRKGRAGPSGSARALYVDFFTGSCAPMAVVVGGEQETLFGFDDDGMNCVVSG